MSPAPGMQAAAQPLGGQDPRSQYLAAAIQALQNRGQGSPQGPGENLLSQMLLQKAYGSQPQQPGQTPMSLGGNMGAQGAAAMGANPSTFGMGQAAPPAPPVGNTMTGQMNPLAAQQGQGNSWPFG